MKLWQHLANIAAELLTQPEPYPTSPQRAVILSQDKDSFTVAAPGGSEALRITVEGTKPAGDRHWAANHQGNGKYIVKAESWNTLEDTKPNKAAKR